jgi:hypothetical protein
MRLLLVHIEEGREMFNNGDDESPQLFVTNVGNTFNDSTFVHYWSSLMRTASAFQIQRFPPSVGRTIFIEDYSSCQHPDKWEGAALIMGNTPNQWRASYMPSKKQRLVQAAVDNHAAYSANCGHAP